MKTRRHFAVNIEGLLSYHGRKKIRILMHDDGSPMTDGEARLYLAECQAKGWKLIPGGDCDGFDYFGKGCPGHAIDETISK
jgi:hypothetical protein